MFLSHFYDRFYFLSVRPSEAARAAEEARGLLHVAQVPRNFFPHAVDVSILQLRRAFLVASCLFIYALPTIVCVVLEFPIGS